MTKPKTVTDNSDVACLSLNDLLDVWDGIANEQQNGNKDWYKGSPMYKNFEKLVNQKLKNQ